jgi:hypothetical protein
MEDNTDGKTKYLYEAFDDSMKGVSSIADEELIKCLLGMKEGWLDYRKQNYDSQWLTNLAFFSGDHDVRLRKARSGQYRVRLKENHIPNIVNKTASLFIQNIPACKVMPMSTKPNDVSNAELCNAYLKHFWFKNNVDATLRRAIKNLCIFGNAFISLKYEEQEMLAGIEQSPFIKGEIILTCEDPFKVILRPTTEDFAEAKDFIKMTSVSKYFIKKKYGVTKTDDVNIYLPTTNGSKVDEENCVVYEYYHLPTTYCPTGMYVVWTGKTILEKHEYPYHYNRLPLYHMVYNQIPTRIYGGSQLEDLIELQEQLNRGISMEVENRNIMANPMFLVPKEAEIPKEAIVATPGAIIRYANNVAPTAVIHGFNFGEINASNTIKRETINQLSGAGGAGGGGIPSNINTAQAYQLFLEQNRSIFVPVIKDLQGMVLNMNEGILNIARSHLDENDKVLIRLKEDEDPAVFSKTAIPDQIDVRLENVNPLFWTEAGKKEEIMELIKMGIVTDKQQALKMLQLNITDPVFETLDINRKSAQKEIEQMNLAIPQTVGPADMHSAHLDEHDKVIARYSFRSLPEQVQAIHLAHREQHLAMMSPQGATMPSAMGGEGSPNPSGVSANPDAVEQLKSNPNGVLPA